MSAATLRLLRKHIENEDLAAVVTVADQVLKAAPNDADVLKIKGVALLKQSDFAGALPCFADSPSTVLERAYCLYKLAKYPECLALLSTVPAASKTVGLSHLEAQVNYRIGAFEQSSKIYSALSKSHEDSEMLTNVLATHVSAGRAREALAAANSPVAKSSYTYEIAYNTACALIDSGDYEAAKRTLKTAHDMCEKTLRDEGFTDEELQDETAVLLVQTAYVLQLQNEEDQAFNIYTDVLNRKPSDAAVIATASNNVVTLRKKEERLFDSVKRLERALKVPVEKLSLRQRIGVQQNHCLLLLLGKKYDKCRETAEQLRKEFPQHEFSYLVLGFLLAREKKFDEARALLESGLAAVSGNGAVQIRLALAHAALIQDDIPKAVATLQDLKEMQYQPAVVATIIALYSRQNAVDQADAYLGQAIAFWQKQMSAPAGQSTYWLLVEKAAEFKMKRGDAAEAVKLYQLLVQQPADSKSKSDPVRVSKVLLATAKQQPDLAAKYAASLPPIPGADKVDMKSLEQVEGPRVSKPAAGDKGKEANADAVIPSYGGTASAAGPGAEVPAAAPAKAKAKRKRKKRLPKNYDAQNPGPMPDPERWLPKFERSYFKKAAKKRNRRKNELATGTQGAVSGPDEKTAPNVPASPSRAGLAAAAKNVPPKAKKKGRKGKW